MPKQTNTASVKHSGIDYYEEHAYNEFWVGREYEHEAELIAIRRLLKGHHFGVALDYGGGYGRLAPVLAEYADRVILTDPSSTLLDYAKKHKLISDLETIHLTTDGVIPVKDNSVGLVTMIRVMHHLEKPGKNLKEVLRILEPGGMAIIEVANSAHAINRLKYMSRLRSVPKEPIHIGRVANGIEDDTPFVNHNAKTIEVELNKVGLKVHKKLSVSNLRSPYLKKHVGQKGLLAAEKHLQAALAPALFGPSIFFLTQKDN
ncbi:MAG: class I SAM-dependent methyltransferase [Candidatus Saccharimonadales bacterium]